jgi:hypothetical protein
MPGELAQHRKCRDAGEASVHGYVFTDLLEYSRREPLAGHDDRQRAGF